MSVQMILATVISSIALLIMPYYCKITYEGKSNQTIIFKMILAFGFFLIGLLAFTTAEAKSPYLIIILVGFFMSLIGDFILGKFDKMKFFVIGAAAFMTAHILYIIAFSQIQHMILPNLHWFNGFEIGVFLAAFAALWLLFLIKKPKFHKVFVAMIFYFCTILLMMTKAIGLGVRAFSYSPMILAISIGAGCFVFSDLALGMMRFKMAERTVVFKTLCTITYFIAQYSFAWTMFQLATL